MQHSSALGHLAMDDLMAGLHADVVRERDPAGSSIEQLLQTSNATPRPRRMRSRSTSTSPRRVGTRSSPWSCG